MDDDAHMIVKYRHAQLLKNGIENAPDIHFRRQCNLNMKNEHEFRYNYEYEYRSIIKERIKVETKLDALYDVYKKYQGTYYEYIIIYVINSNIKDYITIESINRFNFVNNINNSLIAFIEQINLTDDHWNEIMYYTKVSDEFIFYFKHKINWKYNNILENPNIISESMIELFKDDINWNLQCYHITTRCESDLANDWNNRTFSQHNNKTDELYKQRIYKFSYHYNNYQCTNICCRNFSIDFINKFINKVNWVGTTINHITDIEFIRQYYDHIDIGIVSAYYYNNTEVLDEFKDKILWENVKDAYEENDLIIPLDIIRRYKECFHYWCIRGNDFDEIGMTNEVLSELKDYMPWDDMFEYTRNGRVYEFMFDNGIIDKDGIACVWEYISNYDSDDYKDSDEEDSDSD